jgi:anti-sigma regulatory factor (Ser/Thr protein kinase)
MQLATLSATPNTDALGGNELTGPPTHRAHLRVTLTDDQPIRTARHWAEEWLEGWPLSDLTRYYASVVISELLTNAVEATVPLPSARSGIDSSAVLPVLSLCIQDRGIVNDDTSEHLGVLVVVSDFAAGGPVLKDAGEAEESGRGLMVSAGLCDAVEVARGAYAADGTISPHGKRVIASIASAPVGAP